MEIIIRWYSEDFSKNRIDQFLENAEGKLVLNLLIEKRNIYEQLGHRPVRCLKKSESTLQAKVDDADLIGFVIDALRDFLQARLCASNLVMVFKDFLAKYDKWKSRQQRYRNRAVG